MAFRTGHLYVWLVENLLNIENVLFLNWNYDLQFFERVVLIFIL